MRIRIKKLSEVPGGIAARKMADHVPGLGDHPDGLSIPVEYEVEGVLVTEMVAGKSVRMARDKRNGVAADGMFITSPVTRIDIESPHKGTFQTKNSRYHYEFIEA